MADRAQQIMAAARELLDAEGTDTLSMRRIAERVGIRAPSLYRHFPDKAAVEAGLQAQGMTQLAEELEAAEAEIGAEPPLLVLARASPPRTASGRTATWTALVVPSTAPERVRARVRAAALIAAVAAFSPQRWRARLVPVLLGSVLAR
ncbi:helix-turn-helix domain-containing protein [Streptomyces sp. NPDC057686]|uniref:helix-turn-helix domain-containing protein n=1 Tax=Streptomyces sp. NPDC057686 TaxID=3346212 RepID=UPI00368D69B1